MGGQHGTGGTYQEPIPPLFLPSKIEVFWETELTEAKITFPSPIKELILSASHWIIKANGVQVIFADPFVAQPTFILITGSPGEDWQDPVTISYDGKDENLLSITNILVAPFTDWTATRI